MSPLRSGGLRMTGPDCKHIVTLLSCRGGVGSTQTPENENGDVSLCQVRDARSNALLLR